MTQIPDFTENEIWIIQSTVNERYRAEVRLEFADAEVSLTADRQKRTACPAVFWDQQGTSFVIMKTGENRYRCKFFGRDLEMYGAGKEEYDDLAECTVTLLQVQADDERRRTENSPTGEVK